MDTSYWDNLEAESEKFMISVHITEVPVNKHGECIIDLPKSYDLNVDKETYMRIVKGREPVSVGVESIPVGIKWPYVPADFLCVDSARN